MKTTQNIIWLADKCTANRYQRQWQETIGVFIEILSNIGNKLADFCFSIHDIQGIISIMPQKLIVFQILAVCMPTIVELERKLI